MRVLTTLASILCLCALVSGCATKRYGREQEVTGVEKQTLTCEQIDVEIAKTKAFMENIHNQSFDGRNMLGILGDFGIGNSMEEGDALQSAKVRLQQLEDLKVAKGCK